jgi:hypothetical protein
MTTTFYHLPMELQEIIYNMKHQLELKDVLDHMKTWMNFKPIPRFGEPPLKPPNLKLFKVLIYMRNIDDDGLISIPKFLNMTNIDNHIINLKTYKLSQLKEECKINKLKVSGTKNELIKRLIKLQ